MNQADQSSDAAVAAFLARWKTSGASGESSVLIRWLRPEYQNRSAKPIQTELATEGGLGVPCDEIYAADLDLMVVLPDEAAVRGAAPNLSALAAFECRGIILTAKGDEADFVSRFFAPRCGIPEDPVTGSAHCALAPFWAGRLGKTQLVARQVSKRGGELRCRTLNDRVYIAGRATLYLTGTVSLL